MMNLRIREYHRSSINPCIGFHEASSIGINNLEPIQRLTVATDQAAIGMIKENAQCIIFNGQ